MYPVVALEDAAVVLDFLSLIRRHLVIAAAAAGSAWPCLGTALAFLAAFASGTYQIERALAASGRGD